MITNTNTDPDTLGPCGCTDYHMADCPLMTSRFDAGSDAEFDYYYDLNEY